MHEDLLEDLQIACMDTMRGDPPGPILASRLRLACQLVLSQRGIQGARVQVTSSRRGGTRVALRLPAPGRRVKEVVLTLG